jgi:hypothetical protein
MNVAFSTLNRRLRLIAIVPRVAARTQGRSFPALLQAQDGLVEDVKHLLPGAPWVVVPGGNVDAAAAARVADPRPQQPHLLNRLPELRLGFISPHGRAQHARAAVRVEQGVLDPAFLDVATGLGQLVTDLRDLVESERRRHADSLPRGRRPPKDSRAKLRRDQTPWWALFSCTTSITRDFIVGTVFGKHRHHIVPRARRSADHPARRVADPRFTSLLLLLASDPRLQQKPAVRRAPPNASTGQTSLLRRLSDAEVGSQLGLRQTELAGGRAQLTHLRTDSRFIEFDPIRCRYSRMTDATASSSIGGHSDFLIQMCGRLLMRLA